jgi:CHAD domain-containing protein
MFAREDLLRYLRRQQRRLARGLEIALSAGEVEAIHDLRVASRRANEAVKLAQDWVGKSTSRQTGARLRDLRRSFREVRDLDVLLRSLSAPDMAPKMSTRDLAKLEGLVTSSRQRAWRDAVKEVESANLRNAVDQVQELRRAFGRAAPGRDGLLHRMLLKRWRRGVRNLLASPPTHDAAELHPLRVQLKKVRYCTELCESISGSPRSDLITVFTAMQDRLGAWNDHMQAVERLARLAGDAETAAREPAWSAAVLNFAASRAQAADILRGEIVAEWPALATELERRFRAFGEQATADPAAPAAESSASSKES